MITKQTSSDFAEALLVGETGVGVDVRGDGDVGVAEELFHGDERHAGFDEQGRAGVSEIVKPGLNSSVVAGA